MTHEDENKIGKFLQQEIVDDTEMFDLEGVNFDLDMSWKKTVIIN